MKNKKLTYFLGFIVLVVWGLIIYRVFGAMGTDDDITLPVATAITKEPYNDYAIPKDTTHLLLNYRDPFGLTKEKDTISSIKRDKSYSKVKILVPAINWGFIKYSGYIRDQGSKKLIAILNINGNNVNMTEGETTDKVKLIRNMKDSVKIGYNGKTKFILMHADNL